MLVISRCGGNIACKRSPVCYRPRRHGYGSKAQPIFFFCCMCKQDDIRVHGGTPFDVNKGHKMGGVSTRRRRHSLEADVLLLSKLRATRGSVDRLDRRTGCIGSNMSWRGCGGGEARRARIYAQPSKEVPGPVYRKRPANTQQHENRDDNPS